jgi:RNA polymerase sigma-70 factor (ECF subfamily)
MPDPTNAFDHEAALAGCARGDRSALRRLYDVEARQMLGVALRIVRQRHLAEDVVQDAFIKVWEKAGTFDPRRGSARGWLYSVVRNRALNEVRDNDPQITLDEAALEAIDLQNLRQSGHPNPSTQDLGPLQNCLEQLDPPKRSSIVLAYVDGCTHAEIAQRLATPLGTVKAWIRRGLQSLRECLA